MDEGPSSSGFVCIECGEPNENLYVRYSKSVLKLTECRSCGQTVDKYVEYDAVLIMLELLLQRVAAYRHLFYNSPIAGKYVWRLCVVFLLCDAYRKFKRKTLVGETTPDDQVNSAQEWYFYVSAFETLLETIVFLSIAILLTICVRRRVPDDNITFGRIFTWIQALLLAKYGNVLVVVSVIWRLHDDFGHLALTQLLIIVAQMQMIRVSSGVQLWQGGLIVIAAYSIRLLTAYCLGFTDKNNNKMNSNDISARDDTNDTDDDNLVDDDAVLQDGKLVCPGDCIVRDAQQYMRLDAYIMCRLFTLRFIALISYGGIFRGWMYQLTRTCGKGTYPVSNALFSTLPGLVHTVNKLITVRPAAASRYTGDVGDVIVGRIVEVQHKRWKVDVGATLNAVLALSSVNLPSGELRRKSLEDELMMRQYLREGDLVSAEVQQVYHDGMLALHTRSLKYGKLAQGTLIRVPSCLVKRRRSHMLSLSGNVAAIVGCNGFIWAAPGDAQVQANDHLEYDPDGGSQIDTGGFVQDLSRPIPVTSRRAVSRVRNCVSLLAQARLPIYDTSISFALDASAVYETADLLRPSVSAAVAEQVRTRIASEQL